MKLRKVLLIALAVVMLFTMTGCSGGNFMSQRDVDSLVNTYGTPQMQMVVEYTHNDNTYEMTLSYDLDLADTPITVVNFINLVTSGYYNAKTEDSKTTSMIFGNRISGTTNAWVAGRYTVTVDGEDAKTYRHVPQLDYTIKGEFVQNDYVLDVKEEDKEDDTIKDGNNKFELFSLAMYHAGSGEDFDSASGAFFLTTSSHVTENYKNYAVFAYLTHMQVKLNDVVIYDGDSASADVVADINDNMSTTTSTDVVTIDDENDTEKISLLTNLFRIVSVSMTDSSAKDYSKLPTNYKVK